MATELELLPVLASILSPALCSLSSLSDEIRINACNFLKKRLKEMDTRNDESMDVDIIDSSQKQTKPVETLGVMDR